MNNSGTAFHVEQAAGSLREFVDWLEGYGELSRDHQTFFAGPIGGRAKALYYRTGSREPRRVAPMIFCEAFLPSADGYSFGRCDFQSLMRITRWIRLPFMRRLRMPIICREPFVSSRAHKVALQWI